MDKHTNFETEVYNFYMTHYNFGIYCVAYTATNPSDVQTLEDVSKMYSTAVEHGIIL